MVAPFPSSIDPTTDVPAPFPCPPGAVHVTCVIPPAVTWAGLGDRTPDPPERTHPVASVLALPVFVSCIVQVPSLSTQLTTLALTSAEA